MEMHIKKEESSTIVLTWKIWVKVQNFSIDLKRQLPLLKDYMKLEILMKEHPEEEELMLLLPSHIHGTKLKQELCNSKKCPGIIKMMLNTTSSEVLSDFWSELHYSD